MKQYQNIKKYLNLNQKQKYITVQVHVYIVQEIKKKQYVNTAIQINLNYTLAYYNKGICLSNLDRKEDAISQYNKAIELNNNYVNAYFQRGYCYYSLGKFKEAILELYKVIELDNNYPQAYFERGSCLY